MTLPEIIEALEKAEGPDRDLDAWIADVTRLNPPKECPRYTASLDAARTLVPEGMRFLIEQRNNCFCDAALEGYHPGPFKGRKFKSTSGHDQPAIALCIACLKARL